MGDRFNTSVTFGGTLDRKQLAALIEAVEASDGGVVWCGPPDDWTAYFESVSGRTGDYADLDPQPAEINDGEGSYEQFDDLRAWLELHGLAYRWHQDAKYEYDGENIVWFPGMTETAGCPAGQQSEPHVPMTTLRNAVKKNPRRTLKSMLKELAPLDREIPPFVLIGEAHVDTD